MTRSTLSIVVCMALGIGLQALPARAADISKTYVGTFSNTVNPDGSMLVRGGKYVVKTRFNTDDLFQIAPGTRNGIGRTTFAVALDDNPSAGGRNTYELFLPTQGYGTLTQTGQDHVFLGGSVNAPTAEIQFFASCNSAATCATQFRGFELESEYLRSGDPNTPHPAGDIVFEQFTADVGSSPQVTNNVVHVLDESFGAVTVNSGHLDVRSEDSGASGGQLVPGVFFAEAREVVAEAGPAQLVYSLAQQTVTTNAGTEQVTDPVAPIVPGQLRGSPSAIDNATRNADNDLGAGRTDKEDFLNYQWTVGGNTIAGNQDGARLDRLVQTVATPTPSTVQHGPAFFVNGTRSVSNVNISVPIESSGLTTTTGTVNFALLVTEDFTGKSDTDTVSVRYQNSAIASAGAGPDLVFNAGSLTRTANGSGTDADTAINAKIANFELLSYEWRRSGTLIGTNQNQAIGIASTGLTSPTSTSVIDLTVRDRAGTSATDSLSVSYTNAGPTANAGADLVLDANNLSRTADGSAIDADLTVNSLIAGFEAHTHRWTLGGSTIGTTEDLIVGILSSGLTSTLDTAVLQLESTDRAGAIDTDTLGVSYANALPTIGNASATAQGNGLLFELDLDDLDLDVNALVSGFEALTVQILVDLMDYSLFFTDLVDTGSQLVSEADLLSIFGAGPHQFEVRVSDRYILASGGNVSPVSGGFQFDVAQGVPAPGTLGLLAGGLLGALGRRRAGPSVSQGTAR